MSIQLRSGRHSIDVTSLTLANNTAKTNNITVPTGKRWLLLGVKCTNPDNVARSISIYHFKESAKTNVVKCFTESSVASGGRTQYPNNVTGSQSQKNVADNLDIMDAGETIEITWAAGGASAGGTDADGQVLEYIEVDLS